MEHNAINTPESRYRLQKVFRFIRRALKNRYCQNFSEKEIPFKIAEIRLNEFIDTLPKTFARRGEIERLRDFLREADVCMESAYKTETIMNELDQRYNLSSAVFTQSNKPSRSGSLLEKERNVR
jgi:hypothetical protein